MQIFFKKSLDKTLFKVYFIKPAMMVVVAQLVSASGCGPEGRRFEPGLPPHFFCQNFGKKNMKPVKASLHALKVRFMARRAASYAVRRAS